jgi:manganese/iron transport system permease protein
VNWLTEPLTHQFFVYGLLAGMLGGALCGLVGVYVVLRRMSYIGHGLAHAIFGGAAIALILQWNLYLFAGLWGLLSALLINGVSRRRKVGADAAIGVITTASFAVGVILISSYNGFTINLDALLFGSILGVTLEQLWVLAGVALAVLALILLRYRQLLFATFDPEASDAYGVSSRRSDGLFAVILAATVVATLQVLGVTLIAATVVIPAVIARLLTDSFAKMLVISTILGAVTGALGMYTSYYVDTPPGADIVLILAGIFAVVYLATALLARRRLQALTGVDSHAEAGAAIDLS